jgi:hypothetical protein
MHSQDQVPTLTPADIAQPSPARIYDYWLGGSNNFAVDREVAERAAAAMPTLRAAIWANRAFLRRVVRRLVVDHGVTQFLDLGSGVPTVGNVHEIAQSANPACRVVYVDIDPVAVAHGLQLLAGNPQAAVIAADLRTPDAVLNHPQTGMLLDLRKPVAVLMIAVLHFVADQEHPELIVRGYRDATVPGSYLALSHAAPDQAHPTEQATMESDYSRAVKVPFIHRTREQIAEWVQDGFTVERPGIVPVNEWHPERGEQQQILRTYGLLARRDG